MTKIVLPRSTKTGKVAQLDCTTRQSSQSNAVNVRFALAGNDEFIVLDGETPKVMKGQGTFLSQFALVQN